MSYIYTQKSCDPLLRTTDFLVCCFIAFTSLTDLFLSKGEKEAMLYSKGLTLLVLLQPQDKVAKVNRQCNFTALCKWELHLMYSVM